MGEPHLWAGPAGGALWRAACRPRCACLHATRVSPRWCATPCAAARPLSHSSPALASMKCSADTAAWTSSSLTPPPTSLAHFPGSSACPSARWPSTWPTNTRTRTDDCVGVCECECVELGGAASSLSVGASPAHQPAERVHLRQQPVRGVHVAAEAEPHGVCEERRSGPKALTSAHFQPVARARCGRPSPGPPAPGPPPMGLRTGRRQGGRPVRRWASCQSRRPAQAPAG